MGGRGGGSDSRGKAGSLTILGRDVCICPYFKGLI